MIAYDLDSIKNQTHKQYSIFLISDDYESQEEYNQQHAINQKNYTSFRSNTCDAEYLAYCIVCDPQNLLEDNLFMKESQQKFHDDVNKYHMRHCITC